MQPRRRKLVWVTVFVALGALVVVAVALLYSFHHSSQETSRVRAASDRLSPPPAWILVGHVEEGGSGFGCIVSCFHPQITKIYRTTVSPIQACKEIRAQVSRQVARAATATYDSNCGWRAHLASVGARAYVSAGAERASVLRASSLTPWSGPPMPVGNGTYVWVVFSGGPT